MDSTVLPTSFDFGWVAVSFLVSVIGAYTALWVTPTVAGGRGGRVNWFNAGLSGLALGGVGIWSMHFLGMLAYDAPLAIGYRLLEMVVSLVAAVVVSALAIGFMSARPFALNRLLVAGPLAGLGVAVMHYLGMYGMRFGGYFDWNIPLVLLSIGIAIVAATAALWLAFHTRGPLLRAGAALAMGVAVCTMHYTGMAAASVVCTTADRYARLPGLLPPGDLGLAVAVVAVGVALMVAADTAIQRWSAASGARAGA
ncbi:MAG: histidine kinase [Piscinibacter sp.]|nr:histidine kinase [Piscinibacter sp.]